MSQFTFQVLLLLLAAGLMEALAIDGNNGVGEALATSISESLRQMQALQNQRLGDEAAFRQNVAKTLASKQEVLVNPEVAKVVAQANSLSAHRKIPEDAVCNRDWSQPCPDGWALVGTAVCIAPLSYSGGCASNQMLGGSSMLAKSAFAFKCKAPWPCSGSTHCPQGHDYEACPIGWEQIGNGYCRHNGSDPPKCASVFAFGDMQIAEKQELTKDCDLQWACRASCEQDFRSECPEGWQKESSLCVAPVTYAGVCSYSVDTAMMNEAQKRSFASTCSVQFPCVGGNGIDVSSEGHSEKITKDGPLPQASKQTTMGKNGLEAGIPKEWIAMPSGPLDTADVIEF